MPDAHVAQVLANEANFVPTDPWSDLARLDFKARRFMLVAGIALNQQDGYGSVYTNHAAVVTSAIIRNSIDQKQI